MVLKKDFKTNFRNFSKSQTSYAAPPSTRHPPQGQKQAGATEDRQLAFQWSSRALALLLNGKFEQRCVLLLQQLLHQELTTSLYSIMPCLLLNILLLGGMMLSKQCGLLEKPQAVLLLITSQLSFISPPIYFQTPFSCLLTHLFTLASAGRAPQTAQSGQSLSGWDWPFPLLCSRKLQGNSKPRVLPASSSAVTKSLARLQEN